MPRWRRIRTFSALIAAVFLFTYLIAFGPLSSSRYGRRGLFDHVLSSVSEDVIRRPVTSEDNFAQNFVSRNLTRSVADHSQQGSSHQLQQATHYNPPTRSNATFPTTDAPNGHGVSSSLLNKFQPQMTAVERSILHQILTDVSTSLQAANVTFWIDSGTLLGSYRHHDFIPWDDDADLIVRLADKPRARLALIEQLTLSPENQYDLYIETVITDGNSSKEVSWRVFSKNSSTTAIGTSGAKDRPYGFPTVDLLFYDENETHVWSELINWWPTMIWSKQILFPLVSRPLGGRWLPAPCDPSAVLHAEYGEGHLRGDGNDANARFMKVCQSPTDHHRTRTRLARVSLPCKALEWIFPFVVRAVNSGDDNMVTETLVSANKTVQRWKIATCDGSQRTTLS